MRSPWYKSQTNLSPSEMDETQFDKSADLSQTSSNTHGNSSNMGEVSFSSQWPTSPIRALPVPPTMSPSEQTSSLAISFAEPTQSDGPPRREFRPLPTPRPTSSRHTLSRPTSSRSATLRGPLPIPPALEKDAGLSLEGGPALDEKRSDKPPAYDID